MNRQSKNILAVLCILFATITGSIAQDNVTDVVTLKYGRGIIKGFINEQIPGKEIRIIPSEAVLKINVSDLLHAAFKRTIQNEDVAIETDVVMLKDSTTVEGEILEQAPGKWILIRIAHDFTPRSYRYDEIEKMGKETTSEGINIFEAYGVVDVLETKNETIKGIIIEQTLGQSLKIKTLDNRIYVYDMADIVSSRKEAYDKSRDIFKQSAFLDVINLKDGSLIKGIITKQISNHDMQIETIGNSSFAVKMPDIVKLSKENNPYRESM